MKPAIIYDDFCPLCAAYSLWFVKWRLLGNEGRIAFSELTEKQAQQIDLHRAKHKVPVIDLNGGKTLYGVEGLVFVLQQKVPSISYAWKMQPLRWVCTRLYKLVSYNRRVVAASGTCTSKYNCTPQLSLKYRMLYIFLAIIISCVITFSFGKTLGNFLYNSTENMGGWQMLAIAGTGWFVHIPWAYFKIKDKNRRWNYLGNIATLMIIGVLVLLPGKWLSQLFPQNFGIFPMLISLFASSCIMIWQHNKRTRLLNLPKEFTYAWLIALYTTSTFFLLLFYFLNF